MGCMRLSEPDTRTMTIDRSPATLHSTSADVQVEVPMDAPDAVLRPLAVYDLDAAPGSGPMEFGEQLYRTRSSVDGRLWYDLDLATSPGDAGHARPRPRTCSACGDSVRLLFVPRLPPLECFTESTDCICFECYPAAALRTTTA